MREFGNPYSRMNHLNARLEEERVIFILTPGLNNEAIHKLRDWMSLQKISVILIVNPIQIQYLTGFICHPHERFLGLFIFKTGELRLVVPQLELEKANALGLKVAFHKDGESPYPILTQMIQEVLPECGNLLHIAIEKEIMTLAKFEAIQDELKSAGFSLQFSEIDSTFYKLRAVKSQSEILLMKKAAEIVDQILEDIQSVIRVGMAELELVRWIEQRALELGASSMSFDTMVLSGTKSALPHGKPSGDPIQKNHFLLLDFGVIFQGYCSDITRTLLIGSANQEQKQLYEAVREANEAALRIIAPGIAAKNVDAAARDVLEQAGYGSFFTHRVGHGLGVEIHEFPSMHGGNSYLLEPGVTFTVEPGAYLPHLGGVRIEDDVVVTATGVEILTTFTKTLLELQVD